MSTPACTGAPVSWLRLERYLLDELSASARRDVERHLHACPACRACLQFAERSHGTAAAVMLEPIGLRQRWQARWPLLVSAAAVLGGLLLFLREPHTAQRSEPPGSRVAIKGGEFAVALVRERDGVQNEAPSRFSPADRFRVLVSCPPDAAQTAEVIVLQAGAIDFPLPRSALSCGNRVALPGAFQLDSKERATICVLLDPPPRNTLRAASLPGLSAPRACIALDPQ